MNEDREPRMNTNEHEFEHSARSLTLTLPPIARPSDAEGSQGYGFPEFAEIAARRNEPLQLHVPERSRAFLQPCSSERIRALTAFEL